MLEQVSKNIPQHAENRNVLVRGSNKSRVGKCNLGSMEEGRDFGPLTMYLVVKKALSATINLMFMSLVQFQHRKPFHFAVRPDG